MSLAAQTAPTVIVVEDEILIQEWWSVAASLARKGFIAHFRPSSRHRSPASQALERAKNIADGYAVELWEGSRFIMLIERKHRSPKPLAER